MHQPIRLDLYKTKKIRVENNSSKSVIRRMDEILLQQKCENAHVLFLNFRPLT